MHPARAAKRLLEEFHIRDMKDLDLRLLAANRRVLIEEKRIRGAQGRLVYGDGRGTIIVNQQIREPTKKRFVIAHEIGHFELGHVEPHRSANHIAICDESALRDYRKHRPRETAANEFAGELLMPEPFFHRACGDEPLSMDLIRRLAAEFQSSLTATSIRYTRIGKTPAAVVYTQGGFVRWYWPSDHFPYKFIQTKVSPPLQSVAMECIKTGMAPSAPRVLLSNVWFGQKARRDHYFNEQCAVLERYDAVLSLVWKYAL